MSKHANGFVDRFERQSRLHQREWTMRYMFLIYGSEAQGVKRTQADQQAEMAEWFKYSEDMTKAGIMKAGEPLTPTSSATTVRFKANKVVPTDGPFAETKEQLGGYYLVDVPNLEEAIKWAGRCP